MATCYYHGPIGLYCLEEKNQALTRLWLGDRLNRDLLQTEETALLREAHRQLEAYFAGKLKEFSLPLAPAGTPFQLKIWKLVQDIPYGETLTYGQLAQRSGNRNACRAVGMANSRNPLPVFIPCHRVLGSHGKLTGYTGGLDIKCKLLNIEQAGLFTCKTALPV